MAAVGGLPFLSIRARLVLSFILIAMVAIGIVGGFSGALLKHFVERRETAYLQSNASTVARQALSLMVPLLRPLSLLELAQTSAFMSDSRIRIMDRAHRVLADSGPQDGSDHEWVRVVATFPAGNSMVRQMFWIRVSADPARRASQLRSLPVLQGFADTQIMVVRRRSGLWGSLIEFREYDGPVRHAASTAASAAPDDPMRIVHLEPIGDPDNPIGYVEIARSPDVHSEALETIIGPFIIAALAATVLAALLGFVFGRRLTAPIEGLTASAARMGSGDLGARAPTTGSGEIGELGRQFNAMAGKLESTVRDLRQERDVLRRFVADASHELRTPVTALKTFNELLLGGARQDTEGNGHAPAAHAPAARTHPLRTVPPARKLRRLPTTGGRRCTARRRRRCWPRAVRRGTGRDGRAAPAASTERRASSFCATAAIRSSAWSGSSRICSICRGWRPAHSATMPCG